MKVYVIAPDYGIEGYGEPDSAFATRELAEAEIERRGRRFTPYEIFELEVVNPQ